jgi:hypothetical protein
VQKEIYLQIIGKAEKREGRGGGGGWGEDGEGVKEIGGWGEERGGCILPLYMELEGKHCQNLAGGEHTVYTARKSEHHTLIRFMSG